MKKNILLALMFLVGLPLFAKNQLNVIVKDKETKESIIGVVAHIKSLNLGGASDMEGAINITDIPDGDYTVTFSMVGYDSQELPLSFPLQENDILTIYLTPMELEMDEIVVTSTRSPKSILNIPTRIEAIVGEDLDEKTIAQPSNIRLLLTESTGIQVQQTSQVSASASIRIQGLDGKYTQMLQDGLPLYSGYAGGLSILQIPPLNLRQVEVIKGSSSTLYGGGAIAGLINLVTKTPTDKREISLLLNGDIAGGKDISLWYSQKYGKTGLTLYTAGNFQNAYDPDKDGFSDIPDFKRFTINPNFYWYIDKTATFNFGLNVGIETRKGGDMAVLKGRPDSEHLFYERNKTNRFSTQAKFEKPFQDNSVLTIKNSFGYFKRNIERPNYDFAGKQYSLFTEANYLIPGERSEWIFGLNHSVDDFKQEKVSENNLDFTNSVVGVFAQNTYNVTKKVIVESGLRFDMTNRKDFFALPRLSLLYKIAPKWSSRIGGGLGYKTPTIFSEQAEERAFQNILPLDFKNIKPEHSYGINADIDFKTTIGSEMFFSINQMFFYTTIQKPLTLQRINSTQDYSFYNANGKIDTRGFETNVKFRWDDISCFIGYTFTDAERKFDGTNIFNPLTSRHRINSSLMYEIDDKLRLAYELFYFGSQKLTMGERVRGYWVMGASAEYKINIVSLFVNFENFTDVRQSRWGALYTGSNLNPQFSEIYAPTDGFIANGGFKITF